MSFRDDWGITSRSRRQEQSQFRSRNYQSMAASPKLEPRTNLIIRPRMPSLGSHPGKSCQKLSPDLLPLILPAHPVFVLRLGRCIANRLSFTHLELGDPEEDDHCRPSLIDSRDTIPSVISLSKTLLDLPLSLCTPSPIPAFKMHRRILASCRRNPRMQSLFALFWAININGHLG